MIRLKKKFRFEAAHRLGKGYEGKCNDIHGHSWNGHIEVEVGRLDKFDMGVDYKFLGQLTEVVEELYDHTLILDKNDGFVYTLTDQTKIRTTEGNPTSEVLAIKIFELVSSIITVDELPCKLVAVVIKETCTTSCKYKGE